MADTRHHKVRHPKELLTKKQTSKFSTGLVVNHAKVLGSVGFVYFCYILDLVLAAALVQQTITTLSGGVSLAKLEAIISLWVVFIAQTYVQFVALPILQNYQNRQSDASEAKMQTDHEALTYIAQIQDEQVKILNEQTDILNALKKT